MAQHGIFRDKGKWKFDDEILGPCDVSQRTITLASTSAVFGQGNLPNGGYISLSSASTASGNFTLNAPFNGAFVTLGTTAATTGFAILASATGAVTFGSTNFFCRFGSSTAGVVTASMQFYGISTSQWMPIGSFGTNVFTTA